MQQRGPAPVARLVLGTLVAALGAVVVLVGVGTLIRAQGPATIDRAASPAPASSAAPVSTAVPSPGVAAPTPTVVGSPLAPPPADPGATITLVGAGDIGRCDSTADEETAAMIEGMPGIVFTLGDNAYDSGSEREYRDCFGPSWGRLGDRILLPVPGNHDWETDRAAGYTAWFGDRAVRDGTTWYAHDWGAWHIVVLDSDCAKVGGCGRDSPQGRWLRDDLSASRATCTLALFHHPRFSSGEHGSDADVAPLWEALYAGGADLVLNGHEHSYERFGPQDPDGREDAARGITELVVGTGGAAMRDFKDPVANSRVRSAYGNGVISLSLAPAGWTFDFRTTDGGFRDTGSGTCH